MLRFFTYGHILVSYVEDWASFLSLLGFCHLIYARLCSWWDGFYTAFQSSRSKPERASSVAPPTSLPSVEHHPRMWDIQHRWNQQTFQDYRIQGPIEGYLCKLCRDGWILNESLKSFAHLTRDVRPLYIFWITVQARGWIPVSYSWFRRISCDTTSNSFRLSSVAMYKGLFSAFESTTASDIRRDAMFGDNPLVKPNCNSDWLLLISDILSNSTYSNSFLWLMSL